MTSGVKSVPFLTKVVYSAQVPTPILKQHPSVRTNQAGTVGGLSGASGRSTRCVCDYRPLLYCIIPDQRPNRIHRIRCAPAGGGGRDSEPKVTHLGLGPSLTNGEKWDIARSPESDWVWIGWSRDLQQNVGLDL